MGHGLWCQVGGRKNHKDVGSRKGRVMESLDQLR
jgi:hypothetical protein